MFEEQQSEFRAEFALSPPQEQLHHLQETSETAARILSAPLQQYLSLTFFPPAAVRWFDSVLYILSFSRLGEMQHKASVWPPHHLLLKNSVPLASKRATLVSVCQRVDSKSVMWHKGGSADQVCVCGCVCVF